MPTEFKHDILPSHDAGNKAAAFDVAARFQYDSLRTWLDEGQIQHNDTVLEIGNQGL